MPLIRRARPCGFTEALAAMQGRVAHDTETTGLDLWHGDRPYAFAFMDEHGREAYTAWAVDPFTRRVTPCAEDAEAIRRFIAREDLQKTYHNAKFDIRADDLSGLGYPRGRIDDTMFMWYFAVGPHKPSLKLKPLGLRYLEIPVDDEADLKEATRQARRLGRTLGWKLSESKSKTKDQDDTLAPDYWMCDPENGGGPLVRKYAMGDVLRTIMSRLLLDDKFNEPGNEDLRNTYETELRLFQVVYQMETRGVRVRMRHLEDLITDVTKRVQDLEKKLRELTPAGLNLQSGKQLAEFIFDWPDRPADAPKGLGFPVKHWTKGGKKPDKRTGRIKPPVPATNSDALQEVDHPFTNTLIQFSTLQKTLDTKLRVYKRTVIPDAIVKGCWVIHTEFNQCWPVTGRFSSSNPNLQNVTTPTAGYATGAVYCRSAFGPRPGYVWLVGDFEQEEPRVFADIAQEKVMLRLIAESRDIHSSFTNYAWGKPFPQNAIRAATQTLEMVAYIDATRSDKEIKECRERLGWCGDPHCREECGPDAVARRWMEEFDWDIVKAEKSIGRKNTRGIAKMLLFLTIYGGGIKKAAEFFHGDEASARVFMLAMHRSFPGIKRFMSKEKRRVLQTGHITTRFGHRIYVDPDKPYKCVDYHVQGTSAGMLKSRMIALHDYFQKQARACGLDAHLILTVHDELMIEVRKDQVTPALVQKIKDIFEDHGGRLQVALPSEWVLVPKSWDQKLPIDMIPKKRGLRRATG